MPILAKKDAFVYIPFKDFDTDESRLTVSNVVLATLYGSITAPEPPGIVPLPK